MHLTAVGKLNYNDATCILLRTCCFVCKIVHFIAHYNPNMMYNSPEFHIMMIVIWKNKTIAVLRSEPVSGKAVCVINKLSVMQSSHWMSMLIEMASWRKTTLKRWSKMFQLYMTELLQHNITFPLYVSKDKMQTCLFSLQLFSEDFAEVFKSQNSHFHFFFKYFRVLGNGVLMGMGPSFWSTVTQKRPTRRHQTARTKAFIKCLVNHFQCSFSFHQ